MKKQNIKYFLYGQNYFFYLSVIIIMEFVTGMCLSPSCNASMGSVTIETINSDQINSSDYIKISRTTLKTLASQQRKITINDVSGILMVTGFSNILTSTTLNSSHNCPVENISWNDAQTFIVALNAMGEGSYTLPTKAQWEYARNMPGICPQRLFEGEHKVRPYTNC